MANISNILSFLINQAFPKKWLEIFKCFNFFLTHNHLPLKLTKKIIRLTELLFFVKTEVSVNFSQYVITINTYTYIAIYAYMHHFTLYRLSFPTTYKKSEPNTI